MSSDLSQFYDLFFEESLEGLDIMESELLVLEPGSCDQEVINTIFRAAHSIKGGSGTFGFMAVADFTHAVETFLDQIREGTRALESEHVDLLLQSVDCIRALLRAMQNKDHSENPQAKTLIKQFEAILKTPGKSKDEPAPETIKEAAPPIAKKPSKQSYTIFFKPSADLFKTGNEPGYMLMELEELGDLDLSIDFSGLPNNQDLISDDCYFSWIITLFSSATLEEVEAVFEWVTDTSEVAIASCGDFSAPTVEPTAVAKPVAAVAEPPKENKEKTGAKEPSNKKAETTSIRVSIDKVDSLINMVGELVITQAMLQQLEQVEWSENNQLRLSEGLTQLAHNTRDLQESIMQIRMLPISFVFNRFPRLVHDISKKLGKKAELKLVGETTELDKTVMEKLSDPIVHLIRNSLDHGLETPEERIEAGKTEEGTIKLNAFHQGGNIVIEITDDGRGLNNNKIKEKAIERGLITETTHLSAEEINELIFHPGFSTADAVSDLSGRGVGMDVVRKNIQALNGAVELQSREGFGTNFTIRLPLTLAILDGQLVTVGEQVYIIPLVNIIESIQIDITHVNQVAGEMDILRQRDEFIPILRLSRLFNHQQKNNNLEKGLLVIVDSDNGKVGLLVDDLLGQQQVVIKSLEANFQKVEGVSGATILGDGTVSLIVDISGLIKLAGLKKGIHSHLANDHKQHKTDPSAVDFG